MKHSCANETFMCKWLLWQTRNWMEQNIRKIPQCAWLYNCEILEGKRTRHAWQSDGLIFVHLMCAFCNSMNRKHHREREMVSYVNEWRKLIEYHTLPACSYVNKILQGGRTRYVLQSDSDCMCIYCVLLHGYKRKARTDKVKGQPHHSDWLTPGYKNLEASENRTGPILAIL